MRTDDPRLEASRKAMEERIKKYDVLMLAVIKGHLAIEQTLDDFLAASLFHPEYVGDQFSFARKAQVCRSLSLNQHHDKLWDVLFAFNALRNKIAHGQQDETKKGVEQLRRVFMAALTSKQAEGLGKEPEETIAVVASATCASFLVMLAESAKARRKVIDQHWKPDL